MKKISLFILLVITFICAQAQWKQTQGPYAGKPTALIAVGNDLFVSNRYWGQGDGRVYRSTDFGNNWFPADNGMTYTYSLQFENIGNTLFSATAGGVERTQNAGANWVLKYPGAGVVLSMTHRDSVLFVGQEGPGVKVSYNLGETFIPRNNGLGNGSVWVLSMERLGRYVYAGVANGGGYCRLYRTSNDGLNWSLSNIGLPDGADPLDFTINGSTMFVSLRGVGISGQHEYGLYRSLDSGATWNAVNNGLPNNVVGGNTDEIFTAPNGDLYVSTDFPYNEPEVYKSTNNGNSWNVVGATGFRINYPSPCFAAAGGYIFSGLANYPAIFRTGNGGASWEEARKGLANSESHCLMKQNGRVYAGAQEGLFYTTDKGEHWTQITDSLMIGLPVTALEKNGKNIYVGTDGWGIYRSTNNGASFSKAGKGLNRTFADEINDILYINNIIFAATWDGIYKSTNNAASWELASNGLPIVFGGTIVETNTLAFLNGAIYAGTVLNRVYKSTDYGASWTLVGNGISFYSSTINDILPIGNDFYAATDDGLLKSSNAGASWSQISNLVGPIKRLATYKNGKAIFASKYSATVLTGLGVWVSTNKGANFTDYSSGLFPNANVMGLLVDSNLLYGTTDTRSVWTRKIQAQGVQNFVNTIAANEEKKSSFTATATNPFKNKIDIQLQANAAGNISVFLVDNTGRMIAHREAVISSGKSNITITTNNNLMQGMYVLKIIKNEETQTINLLKE